MRRGAIEDGDRSELESALLDACAQARSRIAALEREHRTIVESTEFVSTDDEHDPEGATIAYERELVRSLRDDALQGLVDLEAALVRLRDGTFGRCATCGLAIGIDRLLARPAVESCVACAAKNG